MSAGQGKVFTVALAMGAPIWGSIDFNPKYLLIHGLCFKWEKDVHLETGKKIVIYVEVVRQRW